MTCEERVPVICRCLKALCGVTQQEGILGENVFLRIATPKKIQKTMEKVQFVTMFVGRFSVLVGVAMLNKRSSCGQFL